jgi:hypothetical protein
LSLIQKLKFWNSFTYYTIKPEVLQVKIRLMFQLFAMGLWLQSMAEKNRINGVARLRFFTPPQALKLTHGIKGGSPDKPMEYITSNSHNLDKPVAVVCPLLYNT